jgi:hypothetical protein
MVKLAPSGTKLEYPECEIALVNNLKNNFQLTLQSPTVCCCLNLNCNSYT